MEPRTRQEWAVWVRKAEASELSISDFAARNGVSRSGLYRWRGKLGVSVSGQRAPKPSPSLAFVRLDPLLPSSSTTSPPLEVALANGRVIRVPPVFDEASLARLLNVVEGLPR